jgi:hypothetical protein
LTEPAALDAASTGHPGFAPLPRPRTADGRTRRVGVEIEFVGLDAATAANSLREAFGGRAEREDPHAWRVVGTRLGDLAVELDSRVLHPGRGQPMHLPRLPPWAAALAGRAFRPFVPCELVLPPLPVARLPEADLATAVLRRSGARGAGASAFASLGLHLNVEIHGMDGPSLAAATKAFLLLEPWLRGGQGAERPRWRPRLPGRFPERYREKVLDPNYWPDADGFIEDYLADNPSRDRGLDLLPVLEWLDGPRVRARVPREKVKPRPALHYRLPFAYVGRDGWSIAPAWNGWVEVERLAADRDRLDELCRRRGDGNDPGAGWPDRRAPAAPPRLQVPQDDARERTPALAAGPSSAVSADRGYPVRHDGEPRVLSRG